MFPLLICCPMVGELPLHPKKYMVFFFFFLSYCRSTTVGLFYCMNKHKNIQTTNRKFQFSKSTVFNKIWNKRNKVLTKQKSRFLKSVLRKPLTLSFSDSSIKRFKRASWQTVFLFFSVMGQHPELALKTKNESNDPWRHLILKVMVGPKKS